MELLSVETDETTNEQVNNQYQAWRADLRESVRLFMEELIQLSSLIEHYKSDAELEQSDIEDLMAEVNSQKTVRMLDEMELDFQAGKDLGYILVSLQMLICKLHMQRDY